MNWILRLLGFKSTALVTATNAGFVDNFRQRDPTHRDLLAQLKVTAWTCASINASVCASKPPKLYRRHNAQVVEVTSHPLLTLLDHVNPWMNGFDLWEATTLYQEVFGISYWLLEEGPFGVPGTIWLLPTQNVSPTSDGTGFLYRTTHGERILAVDEVVRFAYPDPRDPYRSGLSPLRACYEQAALLSEMAAFKNARIRNFAIPDAMLWPEEAISDDERLRLETQWNQRMRRAGAGRVIVADQKMHLQILQYSLGDLAALADLKSTKEDVAFAFGVPQPFVSGTTNLANLQAARQQHAELAIRPRIRRRDSKLNEQLIPLFDPSGQLFFDTPDVVPEDRDFALRREQMDLIYGVRTVNEIRRERGLAPVPWGNDPYRPQTIQTVRTDDLDRINAPTTLRPGAAPKG